MADTDDFEIIDDAGLSNEQLFEFVDMKDVAQRNTSISQPPTPDVVLPLLVPKPLVTELLPVVQEQPQPTPPPIIHPPEPRPPVTTTTSTTVRLEIKTTTTSPPLPPSPTRIIPAVPPLPKAPPLQRYGDAALIPHNGNETSDIDAAINTSKKIHQSILHMSSQQQQDVRTITDNMASGSAFSNVLKAKEDLQKSSEQLEQEKRSILAQRIPTLQLDGKRKEDLIEMAKQFHGILEQLHGAIYELTDRFERQKYDMVELSERARQIEKGKAKTRKSNIVHTGLGGGLFTGVNDVTSQAPAKVSLFSRYERLTDRRTFKDRRDVWAAEKQKNDFVAERPKAKIKQVAEGAEDTSNRRTKRVPNRQKTEENADDLPPPPPADEGESEEQAPAESEEPAQEEPAAEEEPAAAEEQNEEEEEEEE